MVETNVSRSWSKRQFKKWFKNWVGLGCGREGIVRGSLLASNCDLLPDVAGFIGRVAATFPTLCRGRPSFPRVLLLALLSLPPFPYALFLILLFIPTSPHLSLRYFSCSAFLSFPSIFFPFFSATFPSIYRVCTFLSYAGPPYLSFNIFPYSAFITHHFLLRFPDIKFR